MRFLTLACLLGSLVFPSGAIGASPPQESLRLKRFTPEDEPPQDQELLRMIQKVKRSFLERDAAQLEDCFGSSKIFVSLKTSAGNPGYYTRSQVHFIFDKLFRDVATRTFRYSPRDVSISKDDRAFLRSEWTYVVLDSDSLVTEHMHFSFEKENEGWRISEVKASSR